MCWSIETCDNCKRSSYSLFKNKSCPYCNDECFIKRITHGISYTFEPEEYAKKHNINMEKEEIKNRILSIAMFEKEKIDCTKINSLLKNNES